MPYEYSAENHDWNLTLRASVNLLKLGRVSKDNNELRFSCLTGSMLLSFSAIESHINSISFAMSRDNKFKDFNYTEYQELFRFWDRLELVGVALNLEMDKSNGLFQVVEQMRGWRNSLTHSTPYSIEITEIVETSDSRKLHKSYEHREYAKSVNVEKATKFYNTSIELINLFEKESGLQPRSMCSYKVL